MKRIISIAILLLTLSVYASAQDSTQVVVPDSTVVEKLVLTSKDSLFLNVLKDIKEQISYSIPRFKLYKTENLYNLILLDTATGRLWQVQYGMNNNSTRMTVPIDTYSLVWRESEIRPGRFELYPTNNMYTFIMVDNEFGTTYQVQWSTSPESRFRTRIY